MKKKSFLILFFLFTLIFTGSAKANYWLIIGTYRQGPGGRPEVSGITSLSLDSITMKNLDLIRCRKKFLIKYSNLFGNFIVNGPIYLEVITNKVTF